MSFEMGWCIGLTDLVNGLGLGLLAWQSEVLGYFEGSVMKYEVCVSEQA